MTKTTLIILILCIGFPIIIVSAILIFKGLKESKPLLPLLASIISLCFLVIFLYSIKNYSDHQENQYVYYVLIDGNEYELTHDKNKIKIFTTGLCCNKAAKSVSYIVNLHNERTKQNNDVNIVVTQKKEEKGKGRT